jgi:hypothetical protein
VLNERQKGAIVCPAVATTRLERASHKSGPNLKAPAMETPLEVIIDADLTKTPFFSNVHVEFHMDFPKMILKPRSSDSR